MSLGASWGFLFIKLIAALTKNQKIDDRFATLMRINAIPAKTIPPINENSKGLVNVSANSVTFIDKMTAWFPASAKNTITINATIQTLMNFPASGGGALPSSFSALYKTKFILLHEH